MRTPLNKLLYSKEIEQKEVCKKLGKSQTYLTQRITGRRPFTLDDAYVICDITDTPYSEIPALFPKSKQIGKEVK